MSYWNHRVIHKYHEKTDDHTYHIHEVYYDDNGTIEGWTKSPVEPMGETPNELREEIRYFIKAFQKPILIEKVKEGEAGKAGLLRLARDKLTRRACLCVRTQTGLTVLHSRDTAPFSRSRIRSPSALPFRHHLTITPPDDGIYYLPSAIIYANKSKDLLAGFTYR